MMRTRAQPGKLTTLINGINKKTHRKESQVWVWLEQCEKQKVVNLNLTQYEFSIPPCINPADDGDEKRISCVQFHSLSPLVITRNPRIVIRLVKNSFSSSYMHNSSGYKECRLYWEIQIQWQTMCNARGKKLQTRLGRFSSAAGRKILCAFFTTIELYFMATFRCCLLLEGLALLWEHSETISGSKIPRLNEWIG